ncbi:MAG: hypothetical protein ACRDP1_12270 [Nocardioidaceae bacterium]
MTHRLENKASVGPGDNLSSRKSPKLLLVRAERVDRTTGGPQPLMYGI